MSHLLECNIHDVTEAGANFPLLYMGTHGLCSDGAAFAYRGNTELASHQSRVPASTFSTVVVQTLCDFV